jgi:methylenetetrahydrofolate--tRNA-(uracil-5-)-methyltransferase
MKKLSNYISTDNEKFQPMNANFGILPQLDTKIKDKQVKYREMANRSLNKISKIIT